MKRLISLLIVFTTVCCLMLTPVSAMDSATPLAETLKTLNLFKGVSETNFDLDRAPTRTEALVMLIRLLGKENEALSCTYKHPFTDVAAWADRYVAYGYAKGLTNGVSTTKFGSSSPSTSAMYITFVLRALGYSDKAGGDFEWNAPFILARNLELLPKGVNTQNFMRSDVVAVSYAALVAKMKGTEAFLADSLAAAGVFTKDKFSSAFRDGALVFGKPVKGFNLCKIVPDFGDYFGIPSVQELDLSDAAGGFYCYTFDSRAVATLASKDCIADYAALLGECGFSKTKEFKNASGFTVMTFNIPSVKYTVMISKDAAGSVHVNIEH